MKIEFYKELDFSSLNVGDFFINDHGKYCLKIPAQDGYNAICFNDIQSQAFALHFYYPSSKCRKCDGKIVFY